MEQLRVNSALLARTSLPPAADTIHLVMDNLSSHSRKAVVERYGEKAGGWLWDRFTVHYTPTHGSWLNQAEIEISLFSRQCLGQRRIASLRDLRREARAWNRRINRDGVTIDWQFDNQRQNDQSRHSQIVSGNDPTISAPSGGIAPRWAGCHARKACTDSVPSVPDQCLPPPTSS